MILLEMTSEPVGVWIGFTLLIVVLLIVDLGLFHRGAEVTSLRAAVIWTIVWISLALGFNAVVLAFRGREAALEFLTGYLIEKSLSMDNLFVFTLVFSWFATPIVYQRLVLFWGILGALVMRGVLIVLGSALLARFEWIVYVFGAFLVLTGIRFATARETDVHPENNPILRLVRRFVPVTEGYEGGRFFVRRLGRTMATPLFLVLVVVESTDLIFAIDSIPAVFAITQDAFIVYTSNVFAILGLRSLYFVLASVVGKLDYLNEGLSVILVFVSIKMLVSNFVVIPTVISLSVVLLVLAATVAASLLWGD